MGINEREQMRKWHDLMYIAYRKAASETTTAVNFKTAMHLAAFASDMAKVSFEHIAHEKTKNRRK